MGNKIYVDSYTGGSDGDDLIDCYFKYKSGDQTWTFHDKDDHSKCTGLTVGSSCSFTLDEFPGITWTITLTDPCTESEVNGDWLATTDDNAQEGGTFQAQDGGGMEAEVDEAAKRNLVIRHIHSKLGLNFGDQLKECFFELRDDGTYDLCDPLDGLLKQGVTSNQEIFFKYASQEWSMTPDFHAREGKAHGSWTLLDGDTNEVDGGTFQAQAGGGGGMEESAYSANA